MSSLPPESPARAIDSSYCLTVAPMMDWTDRHCRYFHRLLTPNARLYTEMVHANAVLRGDRARLLGFNSQEHPIALQLGGSEPVTLAQAARIGEDYGYDEINLNVGCPSDRVQAGRFGACLMREPALVADCVAKMRAAVAIPITVKCRLGVDEQEDYSSLLQFVDTLAAAGCSVFIVHARKAWLQGLSPKENREVPPLRYEQVYRLKRERSQFTVLINGGITTADAVLQHMCHVDGVMLGRAAYHEPYLLHVLQRELYAPEQPLQPRAELLRLLEPYVRQHLAHGGELQPIMRHVLGLFHGQPGGRRFRQVLSEGAHQRGAGWALVERALEMTEPWQHVA